jgi:hypothetical protein
LDTILGGAFSSECENLNELRFPIAERFPAVPASGEEVEPLLPDLGIEAIDLGGTDTLPQVFIDDNHLFMDVLLHAGLVFTDDAP